MECRLYHTMLSSILKESPVHIFYIFHMLSSSLQRGISNPSQHRPKIPFLCSKRNLCLHCVHSIELMIQKLLSHSVSQPKNVIVFISVTFLKAFLCRNIAANTTRVHFGILRCLWVQSLPGLLERRSNPLGRNAGAKTIRFIKLVQNKKLSKSLIQQRCKVNAHSFTWNMQPTSNHVCCQGSKVASKSTCEQNGQQKLA